MKIHKNSIKDSTGERIFTVVNTIFMILLSIIFVYPLYYVAVASFSNSNMLLVNGNKMLLFPMQFTLEAYKRVISYRMIWTGYRNTAFIVVVGTAISLALTIMGAYFMTRKGLAGQKVFSKFVIFTMFFSGGMIPFYLTVRGVGLLDSIWSLILSTAINTYNMIVMRTAFYSVPHELVEASELEGANEFIILWRILVPVTVPTIMVLLLYYAVSYWNGWFYAMIFISDKTKWPLQLLLRQILIEGTDKMNNGVSAESQQYAETLKYAVIMVSVLPMLAIYPFIQKYFMKGVMVGAVKG